MNSTRQLSLVISNYNYGEFLFDAVAAARAQTRPPDEIILIDDCSTDHSRELIAQIAREIPSVRPIYNPQNLGCNRSINEAMRQATGEFVCSAGADDPLHDPTFFARALELCAQHPDAQFCYGEHVLRYQTPTVQFSNPVRMHLADSPHYFSPEEITGLYRAKHTLSVPTSPAIWHRTALLGLGGLRHELSWFADWFAALVLSARTGACHVPGIYQTIRFSPQSFSQAGMTAQHEYRQLLITLLETLEQPEFDDVRPFFMIPAVLSRHGFKLLHLLTHDARFSKYLSLDLVRCAILAENIPFNTDLNRFGASPTPELVREITCEITKRYAQLLKQQSEQERVRGRISLARHYCRFAVDAAPDDPEIVTLFEALSADCARWSRLAGRN